MQRVELGKDIIWLDEVDSTNVHMASLAMQGVEEGTVVAAKFQTEGRGQRGNTWDSEDAKNLTFSILLRPTFLPVKKQFLVSKVVALAICDTLECFVSGISIKWPNDIYVGDAKIAGILIENSFSSHLMDTSIVGIGLNVNQTVFTDDIPNPASLCLLTGKEYDLNALLEKLCHALSNRYSQLISENFDVISNDYFGKLYRKDKYYTYMSNGITFRAIIFGVRDSGELLLKTESGEIKSFFFKEISFVHNGH